MTCTVLFVLLVFFFFYFSRVSSSASKLREPPSFLSCLHAFPTPRYLLHKWFVYRQPAFLHFCVLIPAALANKHTTAYSFITAPTVMAKFTLCIHLGFECRSTAQYTGDHQPSIPLNSSMVDEQAFALSIFFLFV